MFDRSEKLRLKQSWTAKTTFAILNSEFLNSRA